LRVVGGRWWVWWVVGGGCGRDDDAYVSRWPSESRKFAWFRQPLKEALVETAIARSVT